MLLQELRSFVTRNVLRDEGGLLSAATQPVPFPETCLEAPIGEPQPQYAVVADTFWEPVSDTLSSSTLESQSQIHGQKRYMRESSATANGVFDGEFGFDSREWSCSDL